MTKKKVLHPQVDYSYLTEREKNYKASRELYTIFYLSNNVGLTDMEMHEWAKKLNFTGYNGLSPDAIIRSSIYRWNDIIVNELIPMKMCEYGDCQKTPRYGLVNMRPMYCKT